jgi:hypothetical protein
MSADVNPGFENVPGIELSGSSRFSSPVGHASSGSNRFCIGLLLLGLVGIAAYSVHVKYTNYLDEESISALQAVGLSIYDDGQVLTVADPTHRCVTDGCLIHLADLDRTIRVDFGNCRQITDAGLVHLHGNSRISVLRLNRTGVTDAGLRHLSGMTSLEALDLSFTGVSDSGLSDLSDLNLGKLLDLNLFATRISDTGLEQLGKLPGLRFVVAEGTQVTSNGAIRLRSANPEVIVFGIK